jgi:hypothetical protein
MKLRLVSGEKRHSTLFFFSFSSLAAKRPGGTAISAGPFAKCVAYPWEIGVAVADHACRPVLPPEQTADHPQVLRGNVYSAASRAAEDDRRNPSSSSAVITSANRRTMLLRVALCSASAFAALPSDQDDFVVHLHGVARSRFTAHVGRGSGDD